MKIISATFVMLFLALQITALTINTGSGGEVSNNGMLAMAKRFTSKVTNFSRRGLLADLIQVKKAKRWAAKPSKTPGPKPSHHPSKTPKPSSKLNARSQFVIGEEETLCPEGSKACPIFPRMGSFECVDVMTELESCGGCVSQGQGEDCTQIEGAASVTCFKGTCIVLDCSSGFEVFTNERGVARCQKL